MESVQENIQDRTAKSPPQENDSVSKSPYQPKHPISLAVIAKDSQKTLRQMFESVKNVGFAEIVLVDTGSKTDETKRIALSYGARVFDWKDPRPEFFKQHGFISDFAAARQFSFDQCKSEYVFWIDSDDILIGGENLAEQLDFAIAKIGDFVALVFKYIYRRDERKNVLVEQGRTRLVRRESFYWEERVHEDLLYKEETKLVPSISEIYVEHIAKFDKETVERKNNRNITISEEELKETGKLSARIWKHLGFAYQMQGKVKEALEAFDNFLKESDWPEDIYMVSIEKSSCLSSLGLHTKAREVALVASDLCPQFPQAYIRLAEIAHDLLQWDKVIHYAKQAGGKKARTSHLLFDPTTYQRKLCSLKYLYFVETKQYEKALESMLAMKDQYPLDGNFERKVRNLEVMISREEFRQAYIRTAKEVNLCGDKESLNEFLKASPKVIRTFREFSFLKKRRHPPNAPSVAFVCPAVTFDPSRIEKGVGGSEEAVIFLSREMANLGFYVDVFSGDYSGKSEWGKVNWYPYSAILEEDYYDNIILWRRNDLLDYKWCTPRLYFWAHDIQLPILWNGLRTSNVTKFIALSKFHGTYVDGILPPEKVFYFANGLDPETHYADLSKIERDPKRVCYTSQLNRGLDNVLSVWTEIHEKTGAVLHIYYGVEEWHKKITKNSPLGQRKMEKIFELLAKTPAVVNHGMIGQRELSEENARASIWYFPTEWPEIFCISAPRAQANGAIPVCSSFGALDEVVKFGFKVKPGLDMVSKSKEIMLYLLKNPQIQEKIRPEMIKWAREKFPWSKVALRLAKELEGEQWKSKIYPI